MPSNQPADWYPDPLDASRYRYWDGQQWTENCAPATTQPSQQLHSMARSQKWNTAETWATLGTVFVLVPVTSYASRVVLDAGASQWAVAAVAAAVAVATVVPVKNGTSKTRDGVLFGLYLTFALTAILAIARALGLWEGWVMIAVVVPILAVQWLRSRHRGESVA